MELSDRKKKILAAVIDEYIRTAEPVGSKTIAETTCLGCSSATIRNELAELVSLGFLEQPHTSAGRIPTPQGYRMYVNELMKQQKLSLEESEKITSDLSAKLQKFDNLVSDIGNIASQLTDYPAVAFARPEPAVIRRFDLIYIDANTFIIVIMLSNNTVKNKLVHLPVSVGQDMIQRLSSVFNANFTGVTEDGITPLVIRSSERAADDTLGLTSVIASFAIETLSQTQTGEACVTGTTKLLNQPEYRDPDKAHAMMAYLSDSRNLSNLPDSGLDSGSEIKVLIGPENVAEELKDSSVIVASYDAGDNTRG
jgi:heat-inducible transcriptional repressor